MPSSQTLMRRWLSPAPLTVAIASTWSMSTSDQVLNVGTAFSVTLPPAVSPAATKTAIPL
jgi:hypothetical protein